MTVCTELDLNTLAPWLDELEARIDPAVETALFADWQRFANGQWPHDTFCPRRPVGSAPAQAWPEHRINAALDDLGLMLLHQLAACSRTLVTGSGELLNVRANYGTGIMPSLWGVEPFRMDDIHNTLPTNRPLPGGKEAIRRIVAAGVPPIDRALVAKCLRFARAWREIAERWPAIGAHVHCYHPDLQGPLDVVELLWGSAVFIDSYDEPALMDAALDLVSDTYCAVIDAWWDCIPRRGDHAVHAGWLHRGHVLLRNDSAVNFSPIMYAEVVAPRDQRLLAHAGGGGIHFCGRGDHFIESMARLPGLAMIHMTQPHLNNMQMILDNTLARGIPLVDLDPEACRELQAGGHSLRGLVMHR
ncbi:MAG: hypothetical protein PF961_07980 [Planctomycetota bacterium]|jgi:hypothetical protein|nr:hypothetical protein [Planctomycetota bacterium]